MELDYDYEHAHGHEKKGQRPSTNFRGLGRSCNWTACFVPMLNAVQPNKVHSIYHNHAATSDFT